MNEILAKLKYAANSFEIVEKGDYVLCAISGKIKKMTLEPSKRTKNFKC